MIYLILKVQVKFWGRMWVPIKKSKEITSEIVKEAKNFLTTLREDTFILDSLAQFVIDRVN